ncbi:MAG: S49 family peptidase [Pseudonocardiaceae bacterium]|nr:S49 family peptidase [Pseudonocardiaceae bacterium]
MNLGNVTDLLPIPESLASRVQRDRGPVVATVRLHGVITPTPSPVGRPTINLAALESALTRAFEHDRLQAVALAINSPGGSATQSALVADRIRGLAADKRVPVLAFCEDVAASGGYWLACAADEIFAHQTSLVGSIGVVTGGFGLHNLLERWGVERRLYTAGQNKARLDPFLPENDDDVSWLREMQTELHTMFGDWVRSRRGGKLSDGEDLFTGEVWTGTRAVELGLADGIGTLRGVVSQRYPAAEIVTVEPRKPLLARLGLGQSASAGLPAAGPDVALAGLEALEHRAVWSRFGL